MNRFLGGFLEKYRVVDSLARARASSWLDSFPNIGGHFLWEHVEDVAGRRATTAVVLRDPIERTLSHFMFNRQHAEAFPLQLGGQGSLHEALQRVIDRGSREQVCLLSNLQTSILAGYARGSPDPLERLAAARENLGRIDIVGATERLGEFRSALASGLERPDLPAMPHDNQTKIRLRKEDLPSATLGLLLEANRLDAELYRFATARIQERTVASPVSNGEAPRAASSESYGNRACVIESIHAEVKAGKVQVRSHLHAVDAGEYNAGFLVVDEAGITICGTNTAALGHGLQLRAGERRVLEFEIELKLARGRYTVYSEVVDEFSVCHRPLAGAALNVEHEADAGAGLCRPTVKLRQSGT